METSPSLRKRAEPLLSPSFSHAAPHFAAACALYHFEQRFVTLISLALLKANSVERASLTFTGSVQFPRVPVTPTRAPTSHTAARRAGLSATTPTTPSASLSSCFLHYHSYPQAEGRGFRARVEFWPFSQGTTASFPVARLEAEGAPGLSRRENEPVDVRGCV